MLSVKIVTVDSYMSTPVFGLDPTYSQFRGATVGQVPVLRVFGITKDGVKACVHIHRIFPYMYIPVDDDETNVEGFMQRLSEELERHINNQSNDKLNKQHIFKVQQVCGIPFYGYHSSPKSFLKIFFYRPYVIKKAVEILESGLIFNKPFQPYEAHLPFTLQFFIDYNLYGMSFLNVSKYVVRIDNNSSTEVQRKESYCELELDVLGEDILNQKLTADISLDMNPGLVYMWEEEKSRRRMKGDLSQISLVKYDNPVSPFRSNIELQLIAKLVQSLERHLKPVHVIDSLELTSSGMLEASFIENHSQDMDVSMLVDSQVKSLLEICKQMWDEEDESHTSENHRPDEDSILGTQILPEHNQDQEEVEDEEIDLSQPLDISRSDEDLFSEDEQGQFNPPADSGSPDLERLLFVDGNADEEESPKKKASPKKRKKIDPQRYKPLDIIIHKSPMKPSTETIGSPFQNSETKDKCQKIKLKMRQKQKVDLRKQIALKNPENKLIIDAVSKINPPLHLVDERNEGDIAVQRKIYQDLDSSTHLVKQNILEINENSDVEIAEDKFNVSQTSITSFYNSSQNFTPDCKTLSPLQNPPTRNDVINTLKNYNLQEIPQHKPFYGSFIDNSTSKEIGLSKISILNKYSLEEFSGTYGSLELTQRGFIKSIFGAHSSSNDFIGTLTTQKSAILTTLQSSPNFKDAQAWLQKQISDGERISEPLTACPTHTDQQGIEVSRCSGDSEVYSSFDSETLKTIIDIRNNSCAIEASSVESLDLQPAKSLTNTYTYLTLFCLEIHVLTRGLLNPDPEYDQVAGIFFTITNDVPDNINIEQNKTGIIVLSTESNINITDDTFIFKVESEKDIIFKLVELVRKEDPDILVGYEIENSSWGYVIQRAYSLGINLISDLARVQSLTTNVRTDDLNRDLKITGRVVLSVWRMLRHEISLMSYTFESMMYHILDTRVPKYSYQMLTSWWSHFSNKYKDLTINYYLTRVKGVIKLLESLDLIGRTSELASLFGIQFFEVLSRGSQFRVESMMLRLAKPMNYVAISPNIHQRAAMRAPASLPLIMEPQSRLYTDPVIVLDFQSLYPSMMIAYNYCFSTCLGRVDEILEKDEIVFGCSKLKLDKNELLSLKDHIHVSPAGVAFVDSSVRKGILPRMLEEILETRLMVKKSMGMHKNDKKLYKVLHARQLGLKLIANVTYGYTSANFSGRMPCIEVGDSVVSKGRETLERTIKLVHETKRWGAEVVYGDTDSLFVLCPGKTRAEAFRIGEEIADLVTQNNPKPVKLKLEKVYQPSLLQTKKRYAGYMFETANQEKPKFDAKGIETVRRDGCIAVSKILEKALRILFETYDVSKVKNYVCSQLLKISSGKLSIQELTFAREFRGIKGYQPNACVPAMKLVKEWLLKDRRAEPRVGERVGYVVIYGPPGVPIIRLVRSPHEFISNPSLQLNAEYYITKVILPPLQRCFTLIGADVFSWYTAQPKIKKSSYPTVKIGKSKKETLSQYFKTVNCIICNELCTSDICSKCQDNPKLVTSKLFSEWASAERREHMLQEVSNMWLMLWQKI
ncbi:DNA polymerase zeta catalytic subunit isoform X2 [Cimex lectularius]|uniref:DNA polymerase n=1 Tax=Cimex lectularius TaxID=79782 RepID=A0A8I6TLC2_CIMLE|nr:DNA polymerase zeta catalytic subunit isoform X2 [Cimex lectularius]